MPLFKKRRFPNEPSRYDEARVAQLAPIKAALDEFRLPLLRSRQLTAPLHALEMQIECGGDSPEVNRLLLQALRAVIRHQVDERRVGAALRAIDAFEKAEAARWALWKAGKLALIAPEPDERLHDLIQEGYVLLGQHELRPACDHWLEAWELVKQLAEPQWRTPDDFDEAYPGGLQSVFNWSQEFEMELGNAGLEEPAYHEHRVRYAREFLAQFPDIDANMRVSFMRALGEALWELGRRAEAEAIYAVLVEGQPDAAWGYIGWSDQYWLRRDRPKEYDKAEALLKRALARQKLDDRPNVEERLRSLYDEWGKPAQPAQPGRARRRPR